MSSKMEEDHGKQDALDKLLGPLQPALALDSDFLQTNAQGLGESQVRLPRSMTLLVSQGLLVIGFDSGEVQTYSGYPDKFEPGAGFRISDSKPVFLVGHGDNWCPFGNVDPGSHASAIVFASCGSGEALTLWWVLGQEIKLPWMGKIIAGTTKGHLLVYPAQVQRFADMGQMEDTLMVKVAHEGSINCLATDEGGALLLTGGSDGRVAIWQWGADHFLHQVACLFITNMPILVALFCHANELILGLDDHILSLEIVRKRRQHFRLQQNPSGHLKLEGNGGKVRPSSRNLSILTGFEEPQKRLCLAFRQESGQLEAVGRGIALPVTQDLTQLLSFCSHSTGEGRVTAFATTDKDQKKPLIEFRVMK